MQRQGSVGGSAALRIRAAGGVLLVAHLAFVAWLTLRPLDVPWVTPANLQPLRRHPGRPGAGLAGGGPPDRRGAAAARPAGRPAADGAAAGSWSPRWLPGPHGRGRRAAVAGHRAAADRRARPGRRRRLAAAEHRRAWPSRISRSCPAGRALAAPQATGAPPARQRARPAGRSRLRVGPRRFPGSGSPRRATLCPLRLRSVEYSWEHRRSASLDGLAKEPHMAALPAPPTAA